MNKFYFFLLILFIAISCTTVDIEKAANNKSGAAVQGEKQKSNAPEIQESQTIIIERPVFVPAAEATPARPPAGDQAVNNSNRTGIIRPQDYSHSTFIYDYNQDFVFEIYTQPLRVSDISLQPGEKIVDTPFVSDSERWVLGAGVSYDNGIPVQHIYIKPSAAGLSASLIINTDVRVYRIILRSFSNIHMPSIRWRYHPDLPNNYISPVNTSKSGKTENDDSLPGVDPRFLSFNYHITYGLFKKPNWFPKLVFDDGSKTYINFPESVLQRELPGVFENRKDVLNYRVIGNVIIIDKLIVNITVKIGKSEITIKKKRR